LGERQGKGKNAGSLAKMENRLVREVLLGEKQEKNQPNSFTEKKRKERKKIGPDSPELRGRCRRTGSLRPHPEKEKKVGRVMENRILLGGENT